VTAIGRVGRRALLVAAMAAMAGTATALEFRNTADRQFVGQVEGVLLAYRGQYRHWPVDMVELQRFARDTKRPLNLSSFAKVAIRPHSAQTVYVEYETKRPKRERGGFAVSYFEIEPRRRR